MSRYGRALTMTRSICQSIDDIKCHNNKHHNTNTTWQNVINQSNTTKKPTPITFGQSSMPILAQRNKNAQVKLFGTQPMMIHHSNTFHPNDTAASRIHPCNSPTSKFSPSQRSHMSWHDAAGIQSLSNHSHTKRKRDRIAQDLSQENSWLSWRLGKA